MKKETTDLQLLRLIEQGQKEAFLSLYERYKRYVFGVAKKFLGDDMLAEEITQEVWMRVVRGAGEFVDRPSKSEQPVKSWIGTITRNLSLNTLERKGYQVEAITQEEMDQVESTDSSGLAEEILIQEENMRALNAAVKSLPTQQRICLTIWMQEQEDYQTIAGKMNCSEAAVKVLMSRARINLTKALRGKDS